MSYLSILRYFFKTILSFIFKILFKSISYRVHSTHHTSLHVLGLYLGYANRRITWPEVTKTQKTFT